MTGVQTCALPISGDQLYPVEQVYSTTARNMGTLKGGSASVHSRKTSDMGGTSATTRAIYKEDIHMAHLALPIEQNHSSHRLYYLFSFVCFRSSFLFWFLGFRLWFGESFGVKLELFLCFYHFQPSIHQFFLLFLLDNSFYFLFYL